MATTTATPTTPTGSRRAARHPDGNLPGRTRGTTPRRPSTTPMASKTRSPRPAAAGATVTPRATNYSYDADGNQTTVQDARGYTTTTAYNAGRQRHAWSPIPTERHPDLLRRRWQRRPDRPARRRGREQPDAGVVPGRLTRPVTAPGWRRRDYVPPSTASATRPPADDSGARWAVRVRDHHLYLRRHGNLTRTTAPPASNGGAARSPSTPTTPTACVTSETTGFGTSAASTITYCYDPDGHKTAVVPRTGTAAGSAPCETSAPGW